MSIASRFDQKVMSQGECIIWTGATTDRGYGQMRLDKDHEFRVEYAHRIAWWLEHGEWPSEETIDHLCKNKRCVNVMHLEPVSLAENGLRGNPRQHYCKRGHDLTLEGARYESSGGRCVVCHREYQRNRYWAEKQTA